MILVLNKLKFFSDDVEFAKLNTGALKQGHAAFSVFILEAAKHDSDTATLRLTKLFLVSIIHVSYQNLKNCCVL